MHALMSDGGNNCGVYLIVDELFDVPVCRSYLRVNGQANWSVTYPIVNCQIHGFGIAIAARFSGLSGLREAIGYAWCPNFS